MSIEFSGIVGKTQTSAQVSGKRLVLEQKNKKVFENEIWLVCFQRVSPRLKMCDVVFVCADTVWQLSISRTHVDTITDAVGAPVVYGGPDPLPWKKFASDAKKYGWQQEDWEHLFEEESLSDNSDAESGDDDWVPNEEDEEESDDDWEPEHEN